jgi:hypothetical protein
MAVHRQILEWQAGPSHHHLDRMGIIWAIVLSLLFWPSKGSS